MKGKDLCLQRRCIAQGEEMEREEGWRVQDLHPLHKICHKYPADLQLCFHPVMPAPASTAEEGAHIL